MERDELLAQVASLYYEDNLTQSQIGHQLGTSRATISRLLDEARETGIVEIIIHSPWKTASEIERELVSSFPLHQARVLDGRGQPYQKMLHGLGILAARYLENLLSEHAIVGVSWGAFVQSTIQALRPQHPLPITAVQIVGALGLHDPPIDSPDLTRLLADTYQGERHYLHAPLIVKEIRLSEALLQETSIRQTLLLAQQATIALVGVSSVAPETSSLLRAGCLDQHDLARLQDQGAVGEICGRYFDGLGHELETEWNRRVVGIELATLRHIERVIGVVGGQAMAQAILGALRGQYIDVLITDNRTALEILQLQR